MCESYMIRVHECPRFSHWRPYRAFHAPGSRKHVIFCKITLFNSRGARSSELEAQFIFLRVRRMSAIWSSFVLSTTPGAQLSSGYCNRPGKFLGTGCPTNLSFRSNHARDLQLRSSRRLTTIQAGYSDDETPSSASIFVGGFILGGVIVGTLGCIFAPQISKALAVTDRKDLMRKLPKFIYDEEKALEKTRQVLTEKIAQLNSAIDEVSAQLRSESPDATSVDPDEVEAAV